VFVNPWLHIYPNEQLVWFFFFLSSYSLVAISFIAFVHILYCLKTTYINLCKRDLFSFWVCLETNVITIVIVTTFDVIIIGNIVICLFVIVIEYWQVIIIDYICAVITPCLVITGVGFKPFWLRLLGPKPKMEFFDSSFYCKPG